MRDVNGEDKLAGPAENVGFVPCSWKAFLGWFLYVLLSLVAVYAVKANLPARLGDSSTYLL